MDPIDFEVLNAFAGAPSTSSSAPSSSPPRRSTKSGVYTAVMTLEDDDLDPSVEEELNLGVIEDGDDDHIIEWDADADSSITMTAQSSLSSSSLPPSSGPTLKWDANSVVFEPINGSRHSSSSSSSSSSPSTFTLICAWISLFIAVISMSAVGPMFVFLQSKSVPPLLACVWRSQSILLCLIPAAIIEWFCCKSHDKDQSRNWKNMYIEWNNQKNPLHDAHTVQTSDDHIHSNVNDDSINTQIHGNPTVELVQVAPQHTPSSSLSVDVSTSTTTSSSSSSSSSSPSSRPIRIHVSWYVLGVSLSWSAALGLWVVALQYTTTSRASLFCSLYPLIILIYQRITGVRVSIGEWLGVGVTLIGVVLSETLKTDSTIASTTRLASRDGQHRLFGDMLCICASITLAIQVLLTARARQVVPLFTFSFLTSFFTTIFVASASFLLEDVTFVYSSSDGHNSTPYHSVWSWLHSDMIVWVFVFGFIFGYVGMLGFNFAIKYTPPIVFSTVQLLDPGLTAAMSYIAGLEGMPQTSTIIGVGIISIGIALVIVFEWRRKEKEAAQHEYQAVQLVTSTSGNSLIDTPPLHARELPCLKANT